MEGRERERGMVRVRGKKGRKRGQCNLEKKKKWCVERRFGNIFI